MKDKLIPVGGLFVLSGLSALNCYWDNLLKAFLAVLFTITAGYFGYWLAWRGGSDE